MNRLLSFLESIGAKVAGWFTVGYGMFAFLVQAMVLVAHPTTWNRATFDVVVKQIYFTAVQILHVFLGYTLVISDDQHHPQYRTRFRAYRICHRDDHTRDWYSNYCRFSPRCSSPCVRAAPSIPKSR